MTWFNETLVGAFRHSFKVSRPVYSGRTRYQSVEIFDNDLFGRVLALDGVVQTTERDEHFYHEMIVHVPMFAHGAARRVLVVGGGDGGSIEEVLKHPVEQVTMVELDPEVVALCREHLPEISRGAFDDPRLELVIGDGARYLAECDTSFDVIIVDSTDPVGPGAVLFEEPFYRACRDRLTASGILMCQCSATFQYADVLANAFDRLGAIFPHRGAVLTGVPAYGGGYMPLAWASLGGDLAAMSLAELNARYQRAGIETRFYHPAFHLAAMVLPGGVGEHPA